MSAIWNTAVSLFISVPIASCPAGCHCLRRSRVSSLEEGLLSQIKYRLALHCYQPDNVLFAFNQQDLRVEVESWVAVSAGMHIRTHIALDTSFSAAI